MNSKKPAETANQLAPQQAAALAAFTFKNADLNRYSEQIAAIAGEERERNVRLAKIFGAIKTTKCYADDGFSSVADYAEKTFSVKRAMAYQLANVGERFYNSESEVAQKVASLLSPTNLAEVAKMKDDELSEAIDNGDITAESTQSELRQYAKDHAEKKPKVLKDYSVDGWCIPTVDAERKPLLANRTPAEEVPHIAGIDGGEVITKPFAFTNADGTKETVYVSLSSLGGIAVYRLSEAKKAKYTRAELEKMLAECDG